MLDVAASACLSQGDVSGRVPAPAWPTCWPDQKPARESGPLIGPRPAQGGGLQPED